MPTVTIYRDGLRVQIYRGEAVRFGNHEEPGVVIAIFSGIPIPLANPEFGSDFEHLYSQAFHAPGREVYEPQTRNKIGELGAYRFLWDEEAYPAWLEERITRCLGAAAARHNLSAYRMAGNPDRVIGTWRNARGTEKVYTARDRVEGRYAHGGNVTWYERREEHMDVVPEVGKVVISVWNSRAMVGRFAGKPPGWTFEPATNWEDLEPDAIAAVDAAGGATNWSAIYPCPPELAAQANYTEGA